LTIFSTLRVPQRNSARKPALTAKEEKSHHGLAYAKKRARQLAEEAKDHLAAFGAGAGILRDFAEYAVSRLK
jgi:geranylgeranyl pyrophosphate synthase